MTDDVRADAAPATSDPGVFAKRLGLVPPAPGVRTGG